MTPPKKRPLPLPSLRPFAAAARHRSMSAAARELGITQPAVSRHLHMLELALGKPVFLRSPRGLELTESGQRLLDTAGPMLAALDATVEEIRAPHRDRTIFLAMNSGLAQLWLSPRLARFRKAFPNVYLRLMQTDRDEDLLAGDYDLAIRFGNGRWRNCSAAKMLSEIVVPVCAKDYLARDAQLRKARTPAALARARLLHLDQSSSRWLTWPLWFEKQGIEAGQEPPDLLYSAYPLLLQAATDGEGVALGWIGLVDGLLKKGTLVAVGDVVRRDTHGYFLCRPAQRSLSAAKEKLVQQVQDWIAAEFKQIGAPRA
jgi:DNA-binding transcriptional LysR family regulator